MMGILPSCEDEGEIEGLFQRKVLFRNAEQAVVDFYQSAQPHLLCLCETDL